MQNAPWNKGRLAGQKRPLKPKDVWAIRVRLQLEHRERDLALFNLAIDSKLRGCDVVRLQVEDVCSVAPAAGCETAPQSFRRRQAGRFSSRSPSRPEPRLETGFPKSTRGWASTSFRAGSARSPTCRHASMRGSSMPGSRALDFKAPPTARIRCVERRRRRSTKRRATCEPSSCSSDIRSSRAPSDTSASRSMTRSAFPSRSSCKLKRKGRGPAGSGPPPNDRYHHEDPPFGVMPANRDVGWLPALGTRGSTVRYPIPERIFDYVSTVRCATAGRVRCGFTTRRLVASKSEVGLRSRVALRRSAASVGSGTGHRRTGSVTSSGTKSGRMGAEPLRLIPGYATRR
jgi:hypothetical protein